MRREKDPHFPLELAPGPAHFVSRHESSRLPTHLSRRRETRGAGDRLVVASRLALVTRIRPMRSRGLRPRPAAAKPDSARVGLFVPRNLALPP